MNRASFTHWVKKSFPVPESLTLSHTAIDVSDGILRFLKSDRKGNTWVPGSYGAVPFPRLNIEDTPKTKSEAIAILRTWARNQKQDRVKAIVHEDEAYVFKITVPTTDPQEIPGAIEALLEENVPISPLEAIFEYSIVGQDIKINESTVAVSVLSRTELEPQLELFRDAGLEVVAVETEARAMTKALFTPEDKDVHIVLGVAQKHSTVFIVEQGAVVFSSSIEVGSSDFDRAIAKTLSLSEDEARAKKQVEIEGGEVGTVQLFEHILPVASVICDELVKVITFWKGQAKKERFYRDISDVVLVGSDSRIPGFSRYISSITKLPVKSGSPWKNVLETQTHLPTLHETESLNYTALVGALLGDTWTFLPSPYQENIIRTYHIRLATILVSLFCLFSMVGILLALPDFTLSQARKQNADIELSLLEKNLKEDPKNLEEEIRTINKKVEIVTNLTEHTPMLVVLDRILSHKIADIQISSLNLKRSSGSGAITITGVAKTRDALVSFNKKLQTEPSFSKITLPVGNLARSKDIPFNMVGDISF